MASFYSIPGPAGTIQIGTVTTGDPGDPAEVVNSGNANAAVLDITIPKGDAATIAIGTVTAVSTEDPATVTNSGTSGAAVLDFEIPRGDPGNAGDGTAAAPGISFENDPDTGLFRPGNNRFGIATGGVTRCEVTESGDFAYYGDAIFDDGGSFTTTLQPVTPTANRVISLPNATGTVALVGGSSGQVLYNNAGALGGTSIVFDATTGTRFTLPFGYGAGAGGAQTQQTNKSTTVVLNTRCGQITMHNANLAAGTAVSFTLTNSQIAATDLLVINHVSGGTTGAYLFGARAAAGSATITVRNVTAGDLAEALVLGFAVIKASTT